MYLKRLFLLLISCTLGGCDIFSIFSGPTQERGVTGFGNDCMIRMKIQKLLFAHKAFSCVELLIHEGKVILLGSVSSLEKKQNLMKKIERVSGIRNIVDGIVITPYETQERISDGWIAKKVRLALFRRSDVLSQNYHVGVCNKELYIIGVAKDIKEKNIVWQCLKDQAIRKIHDHVELREVSKESNTM